MNPQPDHGELETSLPGFLAGRLDAEERRRFEDHLRRCSECTEIVESWRTMAASLRPGGEAIFTPHPSPLELRALALAREANPDSEVLRHVAACPRGEKRNSTVPNVTSFTPCPLLWNRPS